MLKSLLMTLGLAIASCTALPLVAAGAAPAAEEAGIPGSGAKGSWFGALNVGAVSLRLALEVTEADGKLSAVLDSMNHEPS